MSPAAWTIEGVSKILRRRKFDGRRGGLQELRPSPTVNLLSSVVPARAQSEQIVYLLLSFAWLTIIAWLILRAVRQRGLLPQLIPASPPSTEHAPKIAVIVPARDEEANIARCLDALFTQDYPACCLSVTRDRR
jgi:cellulose synthase/poly-beta-1,6-N-acetylglucosamine synthase-like glycosyltransferase